MTHPTGGPADEEIFVVVRNDQGQYSVWWHDRPVPMGWVGIDGTGTRRSCLDRIAQLWTDPREVGAP